MVKKFRPKLGQIDFSEAHWAPVINCVLKYKNKILVVRRDKRLNFYPNYWNGISGFLDDQKSLKDKIRAEIKEETGLSENHIKNFKLGEIFHQEEPKYKKTWIVHPILVLIDTDKVKLDWEAEEYKWVDPAEAKNLKLLPGFDKVLEKLSKWTKNN